MSTKRIALTALALFGFATLVHAGDVMSIGGDNLLSGSSATLSAPSPRDALVTGFSVNVTGKVEKDVDATGFNVNINAPVGSDLYAAGFSVDVTQPVAEDVTAAGFNIHLGEQARIGGNARMTGGTITIDAPIVGSLAAAGGTVSLNNAVSGDALLTVGTMNFGTNAKILGSLTYYATEPKTIPASVIPADRVQFRKIEVSDASKSTTGILQDATRRVWPTVLGAITSLILLIGFLVAAAAVLFSFAPHKMDTWTRDSVEHPVRAMTLGFLGFSAAIGMIPVSAMTLIGIPLVPVAILAAIVFWIIGYIVGAYAFAVRTMGAFREVPASMGGRLLLFTLALIIAMILNFIPILGWLINLALVFLGLGAIVLNGTRAVAHVETADLAPARPLQPVTVTAISKKRTRTRAK